MIKLEVSITINTPEPAPPKLEPPNPTLFIKFDPHQHQEG